MARIRRPAPVEEGAMAMGEHKPRGHETLLSDEELIERVKANPQVQARAEALVKRMKAGEFRDHPGLTAEELPDFLRELWRRVGD